MWRGYEDSLLSYGLAICQEWRARGFKDTVFEKLESRYSYDLQEPPWLGDDRLHASHRSNLVRKDPWHYFIGLGWKDPNDLPYWWPVP
jgi:hypothetical protein